MSELQKQILIYVSQNKHTDTMNVCNHFNLRLDIGYKAVHELIDLNYLNKIECGVFDHQLEITSLGRSYL